jgi:hypothetical protein
MPKEKPPTNPSGERPPRKFEGIGFFLTPALHDAMKAFAAERKINVADVYREATEEFLSRRETEEIAYRGAPLAHSATRVSVLMAEELRTRMRAAAKSDSQALGNAFETAVRLYLALHQRLGS